MMKKNTTGSSSTVYAQQIMAVLSSVAKAKSILMAIRSKTEAMRARLLLVCSLLRNVKKPSPPVSLSHKIHSLLKAKDKKTAGRHHDEDHPGINQLRQATSSSSIGGDLGYSRRCCYQAFDDDDDDGTVLTDNADDSYPRDQVLPDHSLFDEDHELDQLMVVLQQGEDRDPNMNASVVDLVRNSKEDVGENFSLEAEIDHVADLFIMKFHRKMRMQKLDSFKRYQRMLERSAS